MTNLVIFYFMDNYEPVYYPKSDNTNQKGLQGYAILLCIFLNNKIFEKLYTNLRISGIFKSRSLKIGGNKSGKCNWSEELGKGV